MASREAAGRLLHLLLSRKHWPTPTPAGRTSGSALASHEAAGGLFVRRWSAAEGPGRRPCTKGFVFCCVCFCFVATG
eukprot:3529142-Alexandrium_andersonii.AAC.1